MPSLKDYAQLPRDERLARLERMPEAITAAIRGRGDDVLARRPDAKNWAAKEIVCHLRDLEDVFADRIRCILTTTEPTLAGVDADRWAEERQYLRDDTTAAHAALTRRRSESLTLFRGLAADDWARAGVQEHGRGRRTVEDLLTAMAWHDDNHLDQLRRALDGKA